MLTKFMSLEGEVEILRRFYLWFSIFGRTNFDGFFFVVS